MVRLLGILLPRLHLMALIFLLGIESTRMDGTMLIHLKRIVVAALAVEA